MLHPLGHMADAPTTQLQFGYTLKGKYTQSTDIAISDGIWDTNTCLLEAETPWKNKPTYIIYVSCIYFYYKQRHSRQMLPESFCHISKAMM